MELVTNEGRMHRELLGLTAEQVAVSWGVARRTVQTWDSGKRPYPDEISVWFRQLEANAENMVAEILGRIRNFAPGTTIFFRHIPTTSGIDEERRFLNDDRLIWSPTTVIALRNRLLYAVMREKIPVAIHGVSGSSDDWKKMPGWKLDFETDKIVLSKQAPES